MRLKDVIKFLGERVGRVANFRSLKGVPADTPKEPDAPYFIKVADKAFDELNVSLSGRISVENAELVRKRLVETVKGQPMKNVVIDLDAVKYFDRLGRGDPHRTAQTVLRSAKFAKIN